MTASHHADSPGADGYFDELVAATYDDDDDEMFAPQAIDPVVDLLAELAGEGRALELAVGTGRIALPLSRRGVPVHGIDLSHAMVSRLLGKPGADAIGITIGDMTTTRVDGTFSVVYLVFNTIRNLTTQAAQVACFRNAAAHLEPGGAFVIETGVPNLRRLPPGQRYVVFDASERHWGIDEYDVANQGLISHHFSSAAASDVRALLDPVPVRLAVGARPDGGDGRAAAARPLGRLARRAVHEREPQARLGLGEAVAGASTAGAVLRQLPTAELTAAELEAARDLPAAWPDGGFTDDDFAHGMGGMHWVAEVDGAIVSHASVVERRLEAGDRRCGPGTSRPSRRCPRSSAAASGRWWFARRGVSASAVRDRRALDRRAGVLPPPRLGGVARADVRARRAELERTEDDDGGIFVLRTPSTPPIALTDPLVCDWRSGDVW